MTSKNENNPARHVWVLETGCYDDRDIKGVFATAEDAMEAWPAPLGWVQPYADSYWSNQMDWDDAAAIYQYEVQGFMPD